MKTKGISFILLAAMAMTACAGGYRQDDSGVTVKVTQTVDGGPRLVRLEVMGEKLIHESYAARTRQMASNVGRESTLGTFLYSRYPEESH